MLLLPCHFFMYSMFLLLSFIYIYHDHDYYYYHYYQCCCCWWWCRTSTEQLPNSCLGRWSNHLPSFHDFGAERSNHETVKSGQVVLPPAQLVPPPPPAPEQLPNSPVENTVKHTVRDCSGAVRELFGNRRVIKNTVKHSCSEAVREFPFGAVRTQFWAHVQ